MKLKALSILLLASSVSYAGGYEVNKASFTSTAETLKRISGTEKGNMFVGVEVSTGSAAGSTLQIYDSQLSATNQIATIDLRTNRGHEYNVLLSSGLTYTSTTSSGFTILWR